MPPSSRKKPHRRASYKPPEHTSREAVTFVVLGVVVAIGAMLLALSLSS